MAIGVPRPDKLADWDDDTFTTAPPEDVQEATEADIAALREAKPEEIVEEAIFGASPATASKFGYVDESHKLYVGKEFTREQFVDWMSVQRFGSLPATADGVHHTYIPNENSFAGLKTIHGIFNYYRTQLGWPSGKGPHFWIHSPSDKIFVGTHPAHDGIGISYRNHRWLHTEWLHNGDASGPDAKDYSLWAFVLGVIEKHFGIPMKHTSVNGGRGADGKSSPHDGYLFHRNAKTNIKSCPGNKVSDSSFERGVKAAAGDTKPVEEKEFRLRRYNFLSVRDEPLHKQYAQAATEAINEALVKAHKPKAATHGGGTPERVAYATRKSAAGKFGETVSILVGAPVVKHVHPDVSLIGDMDETDTCSTFKAFPNASTAKALEHFIGEIENREKIKAMDGYRRRIPKM